MNISKQKKIVTILLAAMLVFVLCFSGLAFINVKAEEENNIYPSDADNGIYDAYTDTDIHNSININDYKNYYSNGVTLVDGEHDTIHMQVERSNEIVNFIPRELFKIEGITGYIGKEYGFLTDTFAVEGSDALHTIVLLFNIIINDNSYETKGHLKIRIAPVFQGEFAYITPKTEVIRGIYKGDQVAYDEEHYGNFYIDMQTTVDCIVPVPSTRITYPTISDACYFGEVYKYYLQNFSSMVSLYNENHLNSFDDEYLVTKDEGAYFTQTDFAFSGHIYEAGKIGWASVADLATSVAACAIDIAGAMNPLVGFVSGVIGAGADLASFVKSTIDMKRDAMETMDATEKGLTYTPDYTTAEEQIAHKGYLTKDLLIEVSSGENGGLILGTNDYIEVDYQVSATDPGWRTRYVTALAIEANTLKGGADDAITISNVPYSGNFDFAVSQETIEQVVGEETDVYLLPHGRQLNAFYPKYTGWYTFTTDINGGFYSKITDVNDPANIKEMEAVYSESDHSYRAYLQAGHNHIWEIGYLDDTIGGQQKCMVQFEPQTIAVGNNTLHFENSVSEYMQLKFNENYFYSLSSSDADAVFHLYDKSMNEIESGKTLRIENGGGETVYISVSFENAVTKDVPILCNKERDVVFVTYSDEVIPTHTIVNDAPYVLPTPAEVLGRTFIGWWDNEYFNGEPITSETLPSLNQATITLHANREAIPYTIEYIENGGAEIPDGSYTIDDFVRLNSVPERENYIFMGWYDNEQLSGEPVTQIDRGSTGNRTYYAKWVQEQYIFTLSVDSELLDGQGIKLVLDGTEYTANNFTVNYGESYRLPIAESKGFIFEGWYYGDMQVTDAQGNSIADFTFEENMNLQAKFIRESYKIKLVVDDQHSYWLIQGGISEDEAFIEYSADLCPNCMVKLLKNTNSEYAAMFYRDGYIYDCLTTVKGDNTKLACWHSFVQELVNGAEYTVYAYYIPENYQIYFEGVTGERNDYVFNEVIEYPEYPLEKGYKFLGWYISGTTTKFNYEKMPDLTLGKEDSGSIAVEPKTDLIDYQITYELEGGMFGAGIVPVRQYTVVTETFSLAEPIREGYRFMGWYENQNHEGNNIEVIVKGSTGCKTFYAYWEKEYTVNIVKNAEEVITYYLIKDETITLPNRGTVDPNNIYKYKAGTWTINNGTEDIQKIDIDSDSLEVKIAGNLVSDLTITLAWTEIRYEINYRYQFMAAGYPFYHIYGQDTILEEPVQVIQDHSIFRGYYRDPEFKNQITFISAEEKGPFTIYIKWDHHLQSYSRSSERKITDEDHMKQKSDKVNLYLPDPSTLEFSGFNSILVKIQVEMWEEDDGYQEMYLMDDSGKVLWSVEIEHVRGKKSGTHNVFTADIYIPLDWNEQGFNPLYLRYGGWGNGRDDWWTANVRVDIYLSMEEPKTYDKQHYVWNG